jgi:hypothetical protein
MQNQMMPKINLLQMPDPAARTAKYVNMMNAAKQQEAAERQAAMAQETLDLKKKEDVREEALQAPRLTKAAQENILDTLKIMREGMADLAEGDVAGAEALRAFVVDRIPGWDKVLPPATTWDRNTRFGLMVEAEKEFEKTVTTPTTETAFGPKNEILEVTKGGMPGVAGVRPLLNKPAMGAPQPAPPATPSAPPAGPVPVGKYGEARVIPDNARPLTPDQQDHIRRLQEELGMTNTPASFTRGGMATPTAGQMSPDMVPAILDSAINTGVMAQIDLDQMLAMSPPQARQGIMDVIRNSNISLQADAPSLAASAMPQQQPMAPNPVQRPQADFAVMRGQAPRASFADIGGQPEMRNVMAQTNVVGQQAYGRSGSATSPTPGIYGVPTGQVAETSRAQRASPGELYDVEAAKIKAARDAGPPPSTPQQKRARKTEVANAYTKTQTLVDRAYDPKEGVVSLARKIKALSPDQKEAITGLSGYVPSFRGSTKEADTLIGNLKGIVTALGKDTAAASGNIGPMAAQEWKTVADMIADLKLEGMTPRALDAQMDRIIRQVDLATNLAQRVYDIQFSDDIKEYPEFRVRGNPSARTKTPVVKGGSRISPDIDKILKSRGL